MKKYIKLATTLFGTLAATTMLLVSVVQFVHAPVISAQTPPAGCPGGPAGPMLPGTDCSAPVPPAEGAQRKARNECFTAPVTADNCPFISKYVVPTINALSGAVGIVVVSMVVWGGIQYTSSRDNPQQAAQAKDHIRNALLALIIYIFMVAFLNWIVPGGVF